MYNWAHIDAKSPGDVILHSQAYINRTYWAYPTAMNAHTQLPTTQPVLALKRKEDGQRHCVDVVWSPKCTLEVGAT